MDTWSLVLKALHLIAMVTWFAALFYLPRLFVYHAMLDREAEPAANERFKVMERRLLKGIMTPSLIAIWVFGIWMLIDYAWGMYGKMGWLHAKLTLVVSSRAIMVGARASSKTLPLIVIRARTNGIDFLTKRRRCCYSRLCSWPYSNRFNQRHDVRSYVRKPPYHPSPSISRYGNRCYRA